MATKNISIGIVGGGIAGLYCAWKLADLGYKVSVFEHLNRFGGRIETLDLSGFKAECGPMRFELATQPLFKKLIDDLDITCTTFSPPKAEDSPFPRYLLQQNEKSSKQLQEEEKLKTKAIHNDSETSPQLSHHTSSLDLLKFGIYKLLHPNANNSSLPQVVEPLESTPSLIEEYADSLCDDDYNNIRTDHFWQNKTGKSKLYTIGFWNALARVLSYGAVAKIRDFGTFYHLLPENPNAAEWTIFWLRLFRSDAKLSTIEDGVETIVSKLMNKISEVNKVKNNIELTLNATVTNISCNVNSGKAEVIVNTNCKNDLRHLKLSFDHVILALPKYPLGKLTESFPQEIRNDIESVIGFPLLKLFLVIEEPWWHNNDEQPKPQYGAHVVPTREVHYFPAKNINGRQCGMIMLYTDRPATAYWQPYIQYPHEGVQKDAPDELKDELVHQVYTALKDYVIDHTTKEIESNSPEIAELWLANLPSLLSLIRDQRQKPDVVLSFIWNDAEINLKLDFSKISENALKLLDMGDNRGTQKIKDNVISFAIRDWSKPPFGAACHAWAPGIIVPEALQRLKAFSFVGQPGNNNLHICGEAYSDYQGFIEGSLRSSESVIQSIVSFTKI